MKKVYSRLHIYYLIHLLWALGVILPLKAQVSTPPVVQWQQVIEAGFDNNSPVQVAKASTGDFGILNGKQLSFVSSTGQLKSVATIEGSIQISTSPVQYSEVVKTSGLVPTNDGGFVVLAKDATNLYIIRKDANNNRVWSTVLTTDQPGDSYGSIAIQPTIDGNYMTFASHSLTGYNTNIAAIKVTSAGVVLWNRDIFSNEPTNPAGVNFYGLSKVAAGSDGSYVLGGGQFSQLVRPNPNQGLAAKVDAEGHLVWKRVYNEFVQVGDVIANPYEAGTFLALCATDPNFTGTSNGPQVVYKLQANGNLVFIGSSSTIKGIKIASDGSGQPQFVLLGSTSPQNGGDFKLTGLNQTYEPVWTKPLGGSSTDEPQAILATSDGYLLAGSTTSTDGDVKGKQGSNPAAWVVKLTKTAPPLVMTAPTYNCQTGAITFNTSGGDGSTITYMAPGITRASATDNFGTVEAELRNDPKIITITAIQNGVSVPYNFDLKAACSSTPTPKPPVFNGPIPDQFLTVGQTFPGSGYFLVGSYFNDPNVCIGGQGNGCVPNYSPNWSVEITGLPSGLGVFTNNLFSSPVPEVSIGGSVYSTGVYTVTVKASTAAFRNNPIVTTFKITVSSTTPPPTGAFALVAPDYTCSTGAITFKTTGGDGSAIEYQAAGITGWTTNPNQFVDKDSRTANDVQPFTLMARQHGQVVTYVWDLKAACNTSTPTPKPPVVRPIPDQTYTVGQSVYFVLGGYFSDPTTGVPDYRPNWSFGVTGLPPGVSLFLETVELMFTPAAILVGTATTAGVYTVTATAHTVGGSVSTSFKITVLPTTPPVGTPFALVAPDYNCTSGAITFKTTGGDGSPIEFQAAGITGWTTNPNQFVDRDSRTANDVKPFTLMARQNGQVVTYVWDLKAACGRARVGLEEPNAGLQVRVLGNPMVGQTAEVEISGVSGQSVQLNLVDGQGRALYQHTINQAGVLDQVRLPLGQRSGLLLLQVHTAREQQTVKLLKE